MSQQELFDSQLQFDYFSDNFHRFEEDFYQFSNLKTPLTFIADDLLKSMAGSQSHYFKLTAQKAIDRRDHYFLFRIRSPEENKQVRIYEYIGHTVECQE